MSYTLNFTDQSVDPIGKTPITVQVGTVDTTSTPIALTGKGAANYAKLQQESLLHLLENFASPTAPANPTVGQVWYDSTHLILRVLVDASPQTWKSLGGVQVTDVGANPPVPAALGDLWFQKTGSASGILHVYTGLGRYPDTVSTIGGWEQVHPTVTTFAGREEYDTAREMLDRLLGSGVSAYGAGAIGKSITNLTDFAALDDDLRKKYKAMSPDSNVLISSSLDQEITRQAESSMLFHFNDGGALGLNGLPNPSDGWIAGQTNGVPDPAVNGSILVNNVITPVPAGQIFHGVSQVTDAFILWDTTGTLISASGASHFFVIQQLPSGLWQYDNNSVWTTFTPATGQYVIGTISTLSQDYGTVGPMPTDASAYIWAHAVPMVGTKYEHLKVEPNSHDWDALLAATKYALNRLEVPDSYVSSVSPLPFVHDGRQTASSQTGLLAPSAARRSNRKSSIVTMVQAFSETLNLLNTGITNRFSLRGVNGSSGTNTSFASNVVESVYCTPPSPGLSANLGSGSGDVRVQFRFSSMDELNRFFGGAGILQFELTHVGGATVGDSNLRALLTAAGTWRLTADRTRIYGQALPLTISQPIVNVGLWNGTSAGVLLKTITIGTSTLSLTVYRTSATTFDVLVSVSAGSALGGTTSLTVKTIVDGETYGPSSLPVFAKPLPFLVSDVVNPF